MPGERFPGAEVPELNPAPPLLVVISGPSGAGKDALLAELKRRGHPWHFPVTATTRPPRPGEQHGVDYLFLDDRAFQKMRERDQFLECAQFSDRWYGVPRSQVREGLKAARDVILKIEVQGAETVRQLAPETVSIFLAPASMAELAGRLNRRQTESAEEVQRRLQIARQELEQIGRYDYRVINADGCLDKAVSAVEAIITAEKCRVVPRIVSLF